MQSLILLVLCAFSLLAVAAIIVLLVATRRPTRRCPYCDERVQENASICRFCGRNLDGPVTGRDVLGSPEISDTNVPPSDPGSEPADVPPSRETESDDEPTSRQDPGEPDA